MQQRVIMKKNAFGDKTSLVRPMIVD